MVYAMLLQYRICDFHTVSADQVRTLFELLFHMQSTLNAISLLAILHFVSARELHGQSLQEGAWIEHAV